MTFKSIFSVVAICVLTVSSNSVADIKTDEIKPSSFKSLEIKSDYESYLWRFGDILSDITYYNNEKSAKDLVLVCGFYADSKNHQNFPKWANDAISNMCNFSKTMELLLVKDKKPLGKGHCKDLSRAIKIFEENINSPEFIETKKWSDHTLYYMKKVYNSRFTHSWSGGWWGPDSYDYSCD